jgi:hypothetical protein
MVIKNPNPMEKAFSANPNKYPQKNFKEKACRWCKTSFLPIGPSHHYCKDDCRREVYADKHYKRTYGVDLKWVKEKLQEQDYKCAICNTVGFKMREDHTTGMNLDHDHVTGKPRGLLCHNCNRGLGLFQDNPELLRRAASYVESNARGNEEPSKGPTREALQKPYGKT